MTLSSRTYRATLLAYPADLLREFGDDMVAAFAADLAAAESLGQSLRIWWCCITELIRIAMPAQKENRLVMVPFIAFTAGIAGMGGPVVAGIWLTGHGTGPLVHKTLWQVALTLLEGPVTIAFIGFLVARWSSRDFTYFSFR